MDISFSARWATCKIWHDLPWSRCTTGHQQDWSYSPTSWMRSTYGLVPGERLICGKQWRNTITKWQVLTVALSQLTWFHWLIDFKWSWSEPLLSCMLISVLMLSKQVDLVEGKYLWGGLKGKPMGSTINLVPQQNTGLYHSNKWWCLLSHIDHYLVHVSLSYRKKLNSHMTTNKARD